MIILSQLMISVSHTEFLCWYFFMYMVIEESMEPPADFTLHCKSCEKLRNKCAILIWKLWTVEELRSPRCGLIHISMTENTVPKVPLIDNTREASWALFQVLLTTYIHHGKYCYSYPKGKINIRETMRAAMFREVSTCDLLENSSLFDVNFSTVVWRRNQ